MIKRLSVSLTLEEGSRRSYLSAFAEMSDGVKVHTILNVERGVPRDTIEALASAIKASLM